MERRFWAKVSVGEPDACWPWTANTVNRNNPKQHYGRFRFYGKQEVASRVSYYLKHGPFDASLDVLHTCDNPRCVNPQHLFLGTAKTNGEDMVGKGRSPCGTRNASAKLNEESVAQIYAAAVDNRFGSLQATADHFAVSFKAVCDIKYGYRWNCVTGLPRHPHK